MELTVVEGIPVGVMQCGGLEDQIASKLPSARIIWLSLDRLNLLLEQYLPKATHLCYTEILNMDTTELETQPNQKQTSFTGDAWKTNEITHFAFEIDWRSNNIHGCTVTVVHLQWLIDNTIQVWTVNIWKTHYTLQVLAFRIKDKTTKTSHIAINKF